MQRTKGAAASCVGSSLLSLSCAPAPIWAPCYSGVAPTPSDSGSSCFGRCADGHYFLLALPNGSIARGGARVTVVNSDPWRSRHRGGTRSELPRLSWSSSVSSGRRVETIATVPGPRAPSPSRQGGSTRRADSTVRRACVGRAERTDRALGLSAAPCRTGLRFACGGRRYDWAGRCEGRATLM